MIAANREPDRTRGRDLMTKPIDSVSHEVPTVLSEVMTLGRTLKRRADEVLAYFHRPGTSNGSTEAINADSNTSVAQPSASATSRTTSADHCSRPAASDPDYPPNCEEPVKTAVRRPVA